MELLERLFLAAWPAEERTARGAELRAFWRAQRAEARYRGVWGSMRFVRDVGGDAVLTGVRLRWAEWRRETMRGPTWGTDLRYAWRSLVRARLFSGLATGTLALGIAAITAVFAVVDGVVLRPLPYPDAGALVQVLRVASDDDPVEVSWPDFRDWREQATGFRGMSGYTESGESFEWESGAETIRGAYVTRDFFDVMGVPLAMGRTFTAEEDRTGGGLVMILSDAMWRTRFAADPAVLGTTVPLSIGRATIVGVAAPGFEAPVTGTRYWMPLQEDALLARAGLPTGGRGLSFVHVVARLESPGAIEGTEAELAALAWRIDEEVGKAEHQLADVQLVPLADRLIGDADRTLFLLLAAAALVLLVATANAAGLAVSRTAARGREIAVRAAMGAGRRTIARQLFAEGLILAAGAGAAGLALAGLGLDRLMAIAPPGLPRAEGVGMSAGTVLVGLLAALGSGLVFGGVSAIGARRARTGALRGGQRGGTDRGTGATQQALVTVQVATSVVLLVGAALLASSFVRLTAVDRGFDATSVVVATISPSEVRYGTPEDVSALYAALLERVRAMPGVLSASTTYSPPMFDNGFSTRVVREGEQDDRENGPWVGTVVVGSDYFEANGIPLRAGRSFTDADRLGEPPVIVVNRTMAELLWPGEDPIGKRIEFAGGIRGSAESFSRIFFPREPMTVVGVAADIRRDGLDRPAAPEYYRPHAQLTWNFQYLMVRAEDEPDAVAGAIREAVWSVDPTIPVREVRLLEDRIAESVAPQRFRTVLLLVFAGLTCALALVGLYAVLTLSVTRRMREYGIRMALGARRADVTGQIVRSGLGLVLVGLAAGGLVSAAIARTLGAFLTEMLFGVGLFDPFAWIAVVLLMTSVGAIACWLPARRIGRLDPVSSLRPD